MGTLQPLVARSGFGTLANGDTIGNALNLSNFSGGGYTYNGTRHQPSAGGVAILVHPAGPVRDHDGAGE